MKVAKHKDSDLIGLLKEHGPTHISENAEIGRTECLSFFPVGYRMSSETGETTPVPAEQKKKKKRRRKNKDDVNIEANTDGETKANEEASNGNFDDGEESGKENDDDDEAENDATEDNSIERDN